MLSVIHSIFKKSGFPEARSGSRRRTSSSVLLTLCCLLAGCGAPFQITADPSFIVLDDSYPYDYRATTPDGLVLAVRKFENTRPHGDLDFWMKAIENRLRLDEGYALLNSEEIRTSSGLRGRRLDLGMDRDEQTYIYWVTVFVTERRALLKKKSRVYVVEVGGTQEQVRAHQVKLEASLAGFIAR
jgi:hypothetical protein